MVYTMFPLVKAIFPVIAGLALPGERERRAEFDIETFALTKVYDMFTIGLWLWTCGAPRREREAT